VREYSPYGGGSFGVPGKGKQGNVSFDVSNNVEMKMKSKSDTTGLRKISLIDELGATISYNAAAATRPWSDLSLRMRLKLSKSYTFNLNSSFSTYAYQFDKDGKVFVGDKTEWSYGRFGRFQGYGSSFSYTFNNGTWKKWQDEVGKLLGTESAEKDSSKPADANANPAPTPESEQPEGDNASTSTPAKKKVKVEADSDGYQPFKIPWSLNFSYSFNIREDQSKPIHEKSMRYPYSYTHTLNMSGNIKISNQWTTNFNSGYDFATKEITQTTFTIVRNLHCWNMTASVSPFGRWRSYNFAISASSSILQDLKWEQRSQMQSNIKWF
jgi:hypothetical protein